MQENDPPWLEAATNVRQTLVGVHPASRPYNQLQAHVPSTKKWSLVLLKEVDWELGKALNDGN